MRETLVAIYARWMALCSLFEKRATPVALLPVAHAAASDGLGFLTSSYHTQLVYPILRVTLLQCNKEASQPGIRSTPNSPCM